MTLAPTKKGLRQPVLREIGLDLGPEDVHYGPGRLARRLRHDIPPTLRSSHLNERVPEKILNLRRGNRPDVGVFCAKYSRLAQVVDKQVLPSCILASGI